MTNGFARTYHVVLHYDRMPELNKADLLAALRRHCGTVEPLDGNPDSDALMFLYPDYPIHYSGPTVPAQSIMNLSAFEFNAAKAAETLQQT